MRNQFRCLLMDEKLDKLKDGFKYLNINVGGGVF